MDKKDKALARPSPIEAGQFRLTGYGHRIIRVEKKGKNGYCDLPTFLCPNRVDLEPTPLEVIDSPNGIIVKNVEFSLCLTPNLIGSTVYKGEGLIHTIEQADLSHTGELPDPEKTPKAYCLSDSPRLCLSKQGYWPSEEKDSGFVYEEDAVDLYILLPDGDPFLLRKMLLSLTGRTPIPPLSAFGSWDSRYFEYDDKTVDEEIANYKKHGLPLDNFVIDTDWRAAGATFGAGYTINTKDFPDLKATFKRLHDQNLNVMFNDHPEPVEGANNLFDPKEVAYRVKNLTHLFELGLDYWWYDRNWITRLKTIDSSAHPVYTPETLGMYLYDDVTRRYLKKVQKGPYPKRALVMANVDEISNGIYKSVTNIASHRYGIQWTGDTLMRDDYIGYETVNLIKGGVSLIPYVHGDITGHVNDGSDELYIRYMQLGIFSPIYRLHSTHDVKKFRQPWLWGEQVLSISREYDLLRYRMLPYWYSLARVNYETGIPLCRSIGFDLSDKTRLDEYKIGDALLFSPIYSPVNAEKAPLESYLTPIKAEYFNNEELKGKPVYADEKETLNFDWAEHSPKDGVVEREHFSARFEFDFQNPYDEPITVYFGSDDGVRVYLDGKKLYEYWSCHGYSIEEAFRMAPHQKGHLLVEYFQGVMGAALNLLCLPDSRLPKKDKEVYIPLDGDYVDLFSGDRGSSGGTLTRVYGLRECALFAKMGSIVPLAPDCLNTHDSDWSKLTLACFLSKESSANFTLYEDDRETEAYQDGQYAKTRFSANYVPSNKSFELVIDPLIGEYPGLLEKREYTFDFYRLGKSGVKAIRVDGVLTDFEEVKKDPKGFALPVGGPSCAFDIYRCKATLDTAYAHLVEVFLG